MKKKFKVCAKMTSYCYLNVEAENEEKAIEIAENTDGGEFEQSALEGDWEIIDVEEI